MNNCIEIKNSHPINNANIFSKITFMWLIKYFREKGKITLNVNDLFINVSSDSCEKLLANLELNWNKEKNKKNVSPSLMNAIRNTFWRGIAIQGLILFTNVMILKSARALILFNFLNLLISSNADGGQDELFHVCLSAGLLVLICLFGAFLNNLNQWVLAVIGMRIRVACCVLLYKKLLRLSKKVTNLTSVGQIINLLSVDVKHFDLFLSSIHYLWITPMQTLLIIFLAWNAVGISTFGIAIIFVFNTVITAIFSYCWLFLRVKASNKTDLRVKCIFETISYIKLIKSYVWETSFEKLITFLRDQEIKYLSLEKHTKSWIMITSLNTEKVLLYVILVGCYYLLDNSVSPDKLYFLVLLCNTLQYSLGTQFPYFIKFATQTDTTLKRLQTFLMLDESFVLKELVSYNEIVLDNVVVGWSPTKNILKNINLKIKPETVCAVVGPVGSGKSTLLNLLLSELIPTLGKIQLSINVGYAPQEPWLFSSTVKDNILFGQTYDEELYRKVIEVCCLEKDLESFAKRDLTIVGEKGMLLSGGQKARINLARAVYKTADVYLLDDPFSALDVCVGNHVFEECILKFLKNKTVIIVTHQLQYLEKVDHIVILSNGTVEAQGSMEELCKKQVNFSKILANHLSRKNNARLENDSNCNLSPVVLNLTADNPTEKNLENVSDVNNTITVWEYVRTCGNVGTLLGLVVFFIIVQALCIWIDFWVAEWTTRNNSDYETCNMSISCGVVEKQCDDISLQNIFSSDCDELAIYTYTVLLGTYLLLYIIQCIYFSQLQINSACNLHNKMVTSILRVPMSFFTRHPCGEILNRFSRDMGVIDDFLPTSLFATVLISLIVIGKLITVIIINQYMTIFVVALLTITYKITKVYVKHASDIQHLEGMISSLIFSHITATYNGLSVIRISSVDHLLLKEFSSHQDLHTSSLYLSLAAAYAMNMWVEIIQNVFMGCITFGLIFLNYYYQSTDVAMIGLSVSQVLTLTGVFQFAIRQSCAIVGQMTSVERVSGYTKLEKELSHDTLPDNRFLDSWPNYGNITFNNVSLSYRSNESVLKNISFSINAGEKIGIVGRTGAGKTSIMLALLRLFEVKGSIEIDGVQTYLVPLHILRKRISIVTQESFVFSNTIRYNLDPFGEYPDEDLWNALQEVQLKECISSLEDEVKQEGNNFSVGQGQLICLARAILRKNKIIVLDEATSSTDFYTDALIQRTIQTVFKSCTVITIAHRLTTIMDSDRVLVMDNGYAVEFDNPQILLKNTNGYFYKLYTMVEEF
ncbi:hypothetical protein FQR65_LT10005 [Abscondita terminalis]|nr:hypothetical protein FQR65_LT10005 [Abscondita terminalis]